MRSSTSEAGEARILGFVSATGARGSWFDAQYKKDLAARSPVYSDSRITRKDPKSQHDRLPIVMRNGRRFEEFDCRTPSLCEGELILANLAKNSISKPKRARTIETTLGGRYRDRRSKIIWRNAVAADDRKLLTTDLIDPSSVEGAYAVAWCPNVILSENDSGCPDSPTTFELVWKAEESREVAIANLGRGLHRLMRINRQDGLDLWSKDEASWVLIVPAGDFREVVQGLSAIREEWKGAPVTPESVRNAHLAEVFYLESQLKD